MSPPDLDRSLPPAKKSWGQNFLVDTRVRDAIAACACEPGRPLIELGAGTGALTQALAATGLPVCAIERDRDLVPALRTLFAGNERVTIVEDNALTVEWRALPGMTAGCTLVGNIPYHLTGPLVMRAIAGRAFFGRAVLMVQREVAERMLAPAGARERSSLGVWCELAGQARRLLEVSPAAFRPQPRVWSTVIVIDFDPHGQLQAADDRLFEQVVRAAFGQRRKKLRNALARLFGPNADDLMHAAGVDPSLRAEVLPGEAFVRLTRTLAAQNSEPSTR
jgi:16S rRNA (adenine1518-N6/adenine1519-N6)-dimethyltransferase